MSIEHIKKEWLSAMKKKDFKYFVLKAEDFLKCLDEDEVIQFNNFLEKHENFREARRKPRANNYFVVNRDDTPIKTVDEFLIAVEAKRK